jgi:hypothetical protein
MGAHDLRSTTLTASGSVTGARGRVKAMTYLATATPGSIVIKNGGASGTTVLEIATAGVADVYDVIIPDSGFLCETDVYAVLTNVSSVTVMYEG